MAAAAGTIAAFKSEAGPARADPCQSVVHSDPALGGVTEREWLHCKGWSRGYGLAGLERDRQTDRETDPANKPLYIDIK